MPIRRGRRVATDGLVGLAVALACSSAIAAISLSPPTLDASRLQVLMINGGGTKSQNYQSHLLHLRGLHDLLRSAGVPAELVSLYVSDGDDPAGDVALREVQPEADFWLLEGSRLESRLRTPLLYADSRVPGAPLAAATRAGLQQWFDTVGRTMRPGDTLLLYVTDHGTRGTDDPMDNAITLWGEGERLTVTELAAMLGSLEPGVRVVALMSQCFSGGFAELARARSTNRLPDGSTCGYFSSTADRPAYGCYPENRGRDNVGHSFHFIEALADRGDFPSAHDEVLVRDASPDVPLRTSDVFLADLLRQAASERGEDPTAFSDALLRQAWAAPETWEPQLRLLDRIGRAYGFASPRSLRELDQQAGQLPDVAKHLRTRHDAWKAALGSAVTANVERFTASHPAWGERLDDQRLRDLTPEASRALAGELLAELAPATRAEPAVTRRLELLRTRAAEAAAVAYRMDVRAGVLLRLQALLRTVAGQVYLARHGTPEERASFDAIRRCEAFAVPPVEMPEELRLARAEPFPLLQNDLDVAARVTPAWMGIQFRQAPEATRTAAKLDAGAASVVAVYERSPAEAAGLRPGDVVLGPPGRPFAERDQIREWTMLSAVGEPARLDVLRDGRRLGLTLVPKPFPQEWPKLPGPPVVGSAAPPLRLTPYRGAPPRSLATGKPHLLFFWATWCAVCKAAVPELAAFEREQRTQVIAITDEEPDRLDAFFAGDVSEFPALVARDETRQTFVAYGVSGMPTMVLVDDAGIVRGYSSGYSAAKGLGVGEWRWSGRAAAPPADAVQR